MGGVSMEWKEVDICQLCDSVSETYKGNASEVVLINTSDVLDGKCLNHEYVPNKKLKGQFKKTFRKGDILYSEIRPANKRFCFVDFEPKDYIASTKLMVLRAHEDVDPKYLYQILRSNDTLAQLQMLAESRSGTFPQITYSELSNIMVSLPSQKAQKNIVSILSSLDRKIELNNKINADLEEMAQAIFKNWFVDFEPFKDGKFVDSELGMIPEGWKVGTLEDIAEITMGQSPAGNSLNENREGMIFYQGSSDFGFRFPSIRVFTTEPKRLAVANSVLFSVRAPVGDINVAKEECCIGRGVASIKSKYGHDSYLFYTMKSLHKLFDSFDGEGTVFGSINKKTLSAIQILLPSDGIVEQFNNIASSFDNRIRRLSDENSRLSLLRDTLLPRFMSGEQEVPE